MSTVIIQCAGAGDPSLPGQWLKAYDLEANGGRGQAVWTRDMRDAMTFPSFIEAFEAWRSESVTVPLRPDGKSNRPLTCYGVRFVEKS